MSIPTPEPIPPLPPLEGRISNAKLKPWAKAVFALLFLILLVALFWPLIKGKSLQDDISGTATTTPEVVK